MTALTQTLNEVRNRIALYQGKDLNEQNTKTALIDPVLRALGWEVGNLEEVSQEYRRKPKDKPVDYALFLLRTPKLFVEAKALSQGLDDRKWANQIMGYAAVAGVKWVVLTNGDEYRVYNSCVEVPVEEKMFRAVRLSNQTSPTEETLALLSKERIRDNDIEILWKAHFVDRQIRGALEALFCTDPDPSLLRLVKRRVKDLPSRDIRASLARVRAQFDFPVEPEVLQAPGKRQRQDGIPAGSARAYKAWDTRRGKDQTQAETSLAVPAERETHTSSSLKEVIDAGLLKPPLKITRHYKGKNLEAELLTDGSVRFQDKTFKTLSAAGNFARSTITGRPMSTNGWTFWCYRDQNGKVVPLDAAWQEYLERKAK